MKLASLTLVLLLSLSSPVFAEKGVQHYNPSEGTTAENAMSIVQTKIAEIDKMLEAKTLEDVTFEAIHELSYTIEDAAAKIKGDTAALKAAIEEMHLSSEDRKEDVLRASLPKIKAELDKLS